MLSKISKRNFISASLNNLVPRKIDFTSFNSVLPNKFTNNQLINTKFERFFTQSNSKSKVEILKEKADMGDSEAQYELGSFYLSPDKNGTIDNEKGVHYIKLAAEHNHPIACYMYSMYLKNGFHVQKDLNQSLKYLTYAADHNLEVAQFELALEYYTGKRFPVDLEKAFHYFCLSADNKNAISCETVGTFLIQGIGCKPDMQRAIKYFEHGSELKSALCKYQLSIIYSIDDRNKSLRYLKESADLGFLPAQQDYIKFLLYTEKNDKEAEKYLRLAANQNDAESCINLSDLLKRSNNAIKKREAFLLLKKAANLGNSDAMLRLGKIIGGQKDLSYGIDVKTDTNLAMKYLKNAADQGKNAEAFIEYAKLLISILDSPSKSATFDVKKAEEEVVDFFNKGIDHSKRMGTLDPKDVFTFADFYIKRNKIHQAYDVLYANNSLKSPLIPFKLCTISHDGFGHQHNLLHHMLLIKETLKLMFPRSDLNLEFLNPKGIKNKSKYVNKLKLALDKNTKDTNSKLALSFCYLEGIGIDQDIKTGLEMMKQCAESGNAVAMKIYPAWMFENVDGSSKTKEELDEALSICKKAADENNDTDAMLLYGKLKVYGNSSVDLDPDEGVKYLSKAAELNNVDALYLLGVLYKDGFGVKMDIEKAEKYLNEAKILGHPKANEVLKSMKRSQ